MHFERIRVEPDGRPVIRHMGGSVVWMLFPPLVRPVPLIAEQRRAAVEALEAFASPSSLARELELVPEQASGGSHR